MLCAFRALGPAENKMGMASAHIGGPNRGQRVDGNERCAQEGGPAWQGCQEWGHRGAWTRAQQGEMQLEEVVEAGGQCCQSGLAHHPVAVLGGIARALGRTPVLGLVARWSAVSRP